VTVGEALRDAQLRAQIQHSEATVWDARLILTHTLGSRNPLALDLHQELSEGTVARFEELWDKRVSGVPVQHLLGEWDFYGRTFLVDSRALVPRSETEVLLSAALSEAPGARRVLDAGTGSGILAVSWLLERPESRAVALDISVEALAVARSNGAKHGVLGRLDLVATDWLSGLGPVRFDLAVSNPPYLALSDGVRLPRTVGEHDPRPALFAGEQGLDAIRRLLDELPPHLEAGSPFLFEIGYGQDELVRREIGSRSDWTLLRIDQDLAGIPRVAVARFGGV
jgi:release factor glutamine methyltransferase